MTLSDLKPILTSRWTPAVLVAALALVGVWKLDSMRRSAERGTAAEAALRRAAVAEALRQKGIAVAAEASAEQLGAKLAAEEGKSAAFAAEVARLRKAAPKAKPVAIETGDSGVFTVGGQPGQACRLAPGDRARILTTRGEWDVDGAAAILATGRLLRLLPDGTEDEVWAGPLRIEATRLRPPDPPRSAGWGWGAAGVLTRHGYSIGPAVALPPLTIWRVQLDASAGLTLGSSGEWAGTATVVGRIK